MWLSQNNGVSYQLFHITTQINTNEVTEDELKTLLMTQNLDKKQNKIHITWHKFSKCGKPEVV